MEIFYDLAIHDGDTLAICPRLLIGGDLAPREGDLSLRWGKGGIRNRHLRRMDQRLAVKAEIPPLGTFGGKPFFVLKGVINPINTDDARRARSQ